MNVLSAPGTPGDRTGRPVPATILSGYLGAGKTTLINHLLAHADGRRIGVLVNDIGAVSIDAALIAESTDDLVTLANGCICCTLTDGFATALDRLRPLPLDALVIECSGVADPASVAAHAETPGFTYNGTVVVVDVSTIEARLTDRYVGETVRRQIAAADLLVANKLDLVAEPAPAVDRIRAINGSAALLPTTDGAVALDLIIGVEPAAIGGTAQTGPEHPTTTFTWQQPLDRDAFDRALALADEVEVVRAKGIFDLVDVPERPTIVQIVSGRRMISAGTPWPAGQTRTSAFVVIRRPDPANGDEPAAS